MLQVTLGTGASHGILPSVELCTGIGNDLIVHLITVIFTGNDG